MLATSLPYLQAISQPLYAHAMSATCMPSHSFHNLHHIPAHLTRAAPLLALSSPCHSSCASSLIHTVPLVYLSTLVSRFPDPRCTLLHHAAPFMHPSNSCIPSPPLTIPPMHLLTPFPAQQQQLTCLQAWDLQFPAGFPTDCLWKARRKLPRLPTVRCV